MLSEYAALVAEFPVFFAVLAGILGTVVGSFLNVVIYRVPAGKSIVRPRSQCACGTPIAWYDNIPVLSWFILRGKARCCGRPYSFRYPFVELLVGGLFLWSWLVFPPAKAMVGWVFLSGLVCATFIDLDHLIIPDAFTLGGAVCGMVLSLAVPALHGYQSPDALANVLQAGADALLGILIGSGMILWIALLAEAALKKEAMGFGDVKFMGAIGAFCGWQGTIFSLFGGAIVGTVWFILALLWKQVAGSRANIAPPAETPDGKPAELSLGVHVPFGPMLAIAAGIYFLYAHAWFDRYLADVTHIFSAMASR